MVQRVVAEEEDRSPEWSSHKDFWVGLRKYWLRSTLLVLLNLAVLAVLLVSLRFYMIRPEEYLRWLAGPILLLLLVFVCMQLYMFPLLLQYPEQSVLHVFRQGFLLLLAFPVHSIVLVLLMVVLTVIFAVLAGPVIFLLFSLLAVIQTIALRAIRIEKLR